MKLFLLAALTTLALAAPSKKPKYKDEMVFHVPEFHASEFGMRNPNPDPTAPNKSINLTVIDVHARTVPNAIWRTNCIASFRDPPTKATARGCNDPGFSWYFAEWYGIANWTLNIDHTYYDPKVAGGTGLSVTYFGTGNLTNYDTVKGIFFICAASGAVCAADYKNTTNPIVVPITSAIA